MRTLLIAASLMLCAGALSAAATVSTLYEIRNLPADTKELTVSHIYGEGLAELARLQNLESLTLKRYYNSNT